MADLDASALLLRGLDAVEQATASAREVSMAVAGQNHELREYVRQDAAFHSSSMEKLTEIGRVLGDLSKQVQRAQDREDRREEATQAARAETRGLLVRGASALWGVPELRMLLVIAAASALGVSTGLLQIRGGQ